MSYNKVGDVLVAQGNLAEALTSYRDASLSAERLAKADPSNAGWQRDLSVSYDKIGDVLVAQGKLARRSSLPRQPRHQRAPRQGRPQNAGWQRDLSISYNKIGDVLVAQGKLDEALEAYRDSLAIRERLANADRSNAVAARSLGLLQQGRRRAGGAG